MRKEKEMASFDQTEKIKGRAVEKAARAVIAAGVGLAGCTPAVLRPIEPIDTPSEGQALAIGLLNEQSINNLPTGDVKTSFVNELNDVKKDCTEIPGCISDTIQIYRVNVNDPEEGTNVFSYRFANVEDEEGLRTEILSVMDGKEKEKTEINEDLLVLNTKVDENNVSIFGYVDNSGNTHYLLQNIEVNGKDNYFAFDPDGTSYEVIAQNEKEVQAYSHLWQEPGIVQAEALPTATVAPTQVETPTAIPTETVAPTPTEKGPASTEWQLSPDGHIYYKESELYDGMFTINKEHPEYVEKYWEDAVRGLWNLNFVAQKWDFLAKYPTADVLMEQIKQGNLISNLWIPVIYPKVGSQYERQATLVKTSGVVDLSTIALSIYKPTEEEIYKFSASYGATEYLCYIGGKGEILIKEMNMNGRNILSFGFRKDTLMDETITYKPTGQERTFLAFSDEKTPEENLKVALQLIRSWNATVLNVSFRDPITDSLTIQSNYEPPMMQIYLFTPKNETWSTLDSLEQSPLTVR